MTDTSRRSLTAPLLVAACAGAAVFGVASGFTILQPSAYGWLFNGGVDPSFHFTGWHLFRTSPWTLPPGATVNLGYPVGTSIALTDAIPVMALLLKPFDALLPPVFQYFGVWLLLCFVLQAVCGALLMTTVTERRLLIVLGGTIFALSPLVVHRTGHAALTAHWLLLAGLWLFKRGASWRRPVALGAWVALACVAAATHAYLAVMVVALAVGAWLSRVSSFSRLLADGVMPLAAVGAVMALTWWACGYFVVPGTADLQATGFGQLSFNLLSPFVPFDRAWLAGVLYPALASYGQHEGFAYLGLGGLVLVAVGLALWVWRPARPTWLAAWLAVTCAALVVLALSPVVTLGQSVLLEYPAEWWGPLATFRASGRMVWPAYYAVLLAALGAVVTRLTTRRATAVLALVAALQVADLWTVYADKRAGYRAEYYEPLPSPFWRQAFRLYPHVMLVPSNMCTPLEQSLDYRYFAIPAGIARSTLNGGVAARHDPQAVAQYCAQYQVNVAEARLPDDTIYVLSPQSAVPFIETAGERAHCATVDGHVACVTAASFERWPQELRDLVRQ